LKAAQPSVATKENFSDSRTLSFPAAKTSSSGLRENSTRVTALAPIRHASTVEIISRRGQIMESGRVFRESEIQFGLGSGVTVLWLRTLALTACSVAGFRHIRLA
jgi:hypothetical protein